MRFLCVCLVLISFKVLRAESSKCTIHYQDYSQMDWIRWATSSSDYKSTSDYLSSSEIQKSLSRKGYKVVPEKIFIFDDLMSLISLSKAQNENPHVLRLLPNKILRISKLAKFNDEEKPRLFYTTYKSINDLPQCGEFQKTISNYKTYRDLYVKAYQSYSSGSLGLAFIYLEAIAKLKKNQAVNIIEAERNYDFLLTTLNQKMAALNQKGKDLSFLDQINLVRDHLLMGNLNSYRRSQTSIIEALKSNNSNCVGQTALFIALVVDLNISPAESFQYGVEIFNDHVQFVIVNLEKNINWDILNNTIDQVFETPILKLKSFARSALIQMRVNLYLEDKIEIKPINTSDFLFTTARLSHSSYIAPDKVSTLLTNDSLKGELDLRIDIFSYNYDFKMSTFSNEPVPESAGLAHLIGKQTTTTNLELQSVLQGLGLNLNPSDLNTPIQKDSFKESSFLKMSDLGSKMYDEEALRIYTDVVNQQKYTSESISKYGYHHITKYFPKNHVFHTLAYKQALPPLHLKEGTYPGESAIIYNGGGFVSYWTDKNHIEELKKLNSVDRYHEFFRSLINPYKSFKEVVAPQLIRNLQQNASFDQILKTLKIKNTVDAKNFCYKSFLSEFTLQLTRTNFQCEEFFDHNIPGLNQVRKELSLALEAYYLNKLKNPDQFILELNRISSADFFPDASSTVNQLSNLRSILYFKGKINQSHLLNWTLSYLLRNPNTYYTSEPNLDEIEFEKDLTDYSIGEQTFHFENEILPKVNLPQVNGLPDCSLWSGHGNTMCLVKKSGGAVRKNKLVRKVVLLKPHVLAVLLIQNHFDFRPDDRLFLQLAWKSSNLKSYFEICKACNIDHFLSKIFSTKVFDDPVIGYSELDKQGELKNCNQKSSFKDYSECYFQISKKRFLRQTKILEPSWISEDPLLQEVKSKVKKMFENGKFNDYLSEKVKFLNKRFYVADSYFKLPLEDLFTSQELIGFLSRQKPGFETNSSAQQTINSVLENNKLDDNYRADDYKLKGSHISYSRESAFTVYHLFLMYDLNIGFEMYFFPRKNKIYFSSNIMSNEDYRIFLVPHVDPFKSLDLVQDFKTNYPELYKLDQSLL